MAPVTARRPWLAAESSPVPRRAIIRTKGGTPYLPDAACAGQPVDMFPDTAAGIAAAKAVCATCPVATRTTCLEQAEARREQFGVWGGVDFEGRRRKRKPASSPQTGELPRGEQAMKTAGRLAELRTEHRTLRAVARAAGLSTETARFYLTLLDLDPASQERIRSGEITPSAAVAAVRSERRSRERAS